VKATIICKQYLPKIWNCRVVSWRKKMSFRK